MLAGMGANFLYTAISRCKAAGKKTHYHWRGMAVGPSRDLYRPIYMTTSSRQLDVAEDGSRRALTFLARERRAANQRSKKFETVSLGRPHRKRLEIAKRFTLNQLRFRARALKFEIRPVRGAPFFSSK